jgi:type I restriction enzyme S subunit
VGLSVGRQVNEMAELKSKPDIRFAEFDDAWEQRKLGDLAQSFEYGLNAAACEYDGENKYLRITDIDDETHEFNFDALTSPDVDLTNAENYKLREGDILFARTGASVGKTYRYKAFDGLVYFAGFLIRARIKPEYDSEFVFQNTLTSRYNRYIAVTSQRSGQPGVNAQEYGEFELSVPSLPEQQKLCAFFSNFDRLITLHQREYDKTVNIKKAMLEKMFPKDGADRPEIRFTGFTDAWEQRKLGDVVTIKSGGSPLSFREGNNLYVKVDDLNHSTREQYNTQMRVADNPRFSKARKGSTIFPKRGAAIMTNKVRIISDDGYMDTNMMALDPGGIDGSFLFVLIGRTGLYKIADTSTIPQINNKHIEPYQVLVPQIDEQKKIATVFEYFDDLITLHQRELEKLQNMKKALLGKMFV